MAYGQQPSEKSMQNLVTTADRDPEERKEMQKKGGIASGKARREKRMFKELLELALSGKVENKNGERKTRKEVSMLMLAEKCMRGDLRAIALAESILGEAQASKVEVTGKDGRDLIPAKRLTKEEAAELLSSLENEF